MTNIQNKKTGCLFLLLSLRSCKFFLSQKSLTNFLSPPIGYFGVTCSFWTILWLRVLITFRPINFTPCAGTGFNYLWCSSLGQGGKANQKQGSARKRQVDPGGLGVGGNWLAPITEESKAQAWIWHLWETSSLSEDAPSRPPPPSSKSPSPLNTATAIASCFPHNISWLPVHSLLTSGVTFFKCTCRLA